MRRISRRPRCAPASSSPPGILGSARCRSRGGARDRERRHSAANRFAVAFMARALVRASVETRVVWSRRVFVPRAPASAGVPTRHARVRAPREQQVPHFPMQFLHTSQVDSCLCHAARHNRPRRSPYLRPAPASLPNGHQSAFRPQREPPTAMNLLAYAGGSLMRIRPGCLFASVSARGGG